MPEVRELIGTMDGIIMEADMLIRDRNASREKLWPLRLRMASTITLFQFALNARLTLDAGRDDRQTADLRRASDEWATLATEFSAFTKLVQTSAAPSWADYIRQARVFMHRFYDQMRRIGDLLPMSDGRSASCDSLPGARSAG